MIRFVLGLAAALALQFVYLASQAKNRVLVAPDQRQNERVEKHVDSRHKIVAALARFDLLSDGVPVEFDDAV